MYNIEKTTLGEELMVKHIIVWKLIDGIDKQSVKQEIKSKLEGLVGKIDGLVKMEININALDSSSGDLSMDSVFENEQALKDYQVHPLHKEIANGLVRPNVCERLSFDYEA